MKDDLDAYMYVLCLGNVGTLLPHVLNTGLLAASTATTPLQGTVHSARQRYIDLQTSILVCTKYPPKNSTSGCNRRCRASQLRSCCICCYFAQVLPYCPCSTPSIAAFIIPSTTCLVPRLFVFSLLTQPPLPELSCIQVELC